MSYSSSLTPSISQIQLNAIMIRVLTITALSLTDSISLSNGKRKASATRFTGKPGLNHGNTSLLVVNGWMQLRWLHWFLSIVSCRRLIRIVFSRVDLCNEHMYKYFGHDCIYIYSPLPCSLDFY